MEKTKIVTLEDRIPKLKQQRRKKANRRLILLLFLFFSLIAVVAYVQSPLSHIKSIHVTGNDFYSSNEIIQKTGLTTDTNIWTVNRNNISAKLERLPEIKKAVVNIRFPNSLDIQLIEHKRIAYLKQNSDYYPVLENGTILKKQKIGKLPINAPVMINFKEGAVLDELLREIEKLPDVVLNSISEIHFTPTKTDRFHLTLFMNDGFEVSATTTSFAEKMALYPSIISQLDPNKKGIIDLEVGSYFKAYDAKGQGKLNNAKSVR